MPAHYKFSNNHTESKQFLYLFLYRAIILDMQLGGNKYYDNSQLRWIKGKCNQRNINTNCVNILPAIWNNSIAKFAAE